MAEKASRRGAVDMGMVLMLLSFAVIGYFMYWLQGQAAMERAAATVVEDTADVAADPYADAPSVAAGDLVTGAGAGQYAGQIVRVQPTQVASALGRQGFWLDVPQSPFLISYSQQMILDSMTVAPGSTVTVAGTVRAMSDSVAASWFQAGRIGEGDQLAASFASYFIDAERIQPVGGN